MIDVDSDAVLAKGMAERIAESEPGNVVHKVDGEEFRLDLDLADHTVALKNIVDLFRANGPDIDQAVAVAHRVVHGGRKFRATTLIDDSVVAAIEETIPLAPLHNPAALQGIRAARALLPSVPQTAIFDTSFFSDLPPEAYSYALPTELAEKLNIRKYGFHGTSHEYVSGLVSEILGKPKLRQIVCHLGNGASVSAIVDGVGVEISMAFTPMSGLVMGTRCGDIDPGIHAYVCQETGMSIAEFSDLCFKRSGVLGMTGKTDMRDVWAEAEAGDAQAKIALDLYMHRLAMYIAGYHAIIGGAEAITFTAGVGENDERIRNGVCDRLACFGIKLNDEIKDIRHIRENTILSTPDSAIAVLVVPTNEELSMARQTAALIS